MTCTNKQFWKLVEECQRERATDRPGDGEHFATFGDRLPKALSDELAALEKRLG